jgi:hypothetical protein
MSAREFMDRLNQVKAGVKEGDAPADLSAKLAEVTALVRKTYAADELKAALASNAAVPTGLEESMTTLFMLWMSQRGRA